MAAGNNNPGATPVVPDELPKDKPNPLIQTLQGGDRAEPTGEQQLDSTSLLFNDATNRRQQIERSDSNNVGPYKVTNPDGSVINGMTFKGPDGKLVFKGPDNIPYYMTPNDKGGTNFTSTRRDAPVIGDGPAARNPLASVVGDLPASRRTATLPAESAVVANPVRPAVQPVETNLTGNRTVIPAVTERLAGVPDRRIQEAVVPPVKEGTTPLGRMTEAFVTPGVTRIEPGKAVTDGVNPVARVEPLPVNRFADGVAPVLRGEVPAVKGDTPVIKSDTPLGRMTEAFVTPVKAEPVIKADTGFVPPSERLRGFVQEHNTGTPVPIKDLVTRDGFRDLTTPNPRDFKVPEFDRNQWRQDRFDPAKAFGDRGEFPGGIRDIKFPGGEQNQARFAEWKAAQELAARTPKDIPMPRNWEDKLVRTNPEALAQFQKSWMEARDRDGRMGGEFGMRGRMDANEAAARAAALDALKGGPNQKGIPGFDLNDRASREFLNDAMKRMELTKGQRVDDIFKGLDQAKAERLTKFLTEGSTDGKFNPARVRDFMTMNDQFKNPTERLYDFLKVNKDLLNNQQLSTRDTQRALGDLTKVLGDVNRQLGLDGKGALNIQDVLGRKLDPTRPGERLAAMEQNGINRALTDRQESMTVTARMTAAQEIALRQMLDARNGRDAATPTGRTGQEGMQAGRDMGARFEGPQARIDAAQTAAANAANAARMVEGQGRAELAPAVKAEVPVKADARPEVANRPDMIQAQRQQDIAVPGAKQAETRADRVDANPFDKKDDKVLDEKARHKKEEEEKEKREKEEQHKREEKQRLDALMLAALAEKKRKQMEQEQKEKEKSEEKDKQRDREKRRRYIVREKDTLQSIASAQLRDVRLAPLIYEINKQVILLRMENGKQVPDLKPKMIIWLPSTTEIEEFRKGGITGAKQAGGSTDKKMSADDELVARFGKGWSGGGAPGAPASGAATNSATGPSTVIPGSQPATSAEVTAALAASAMEAAQKKRANIESLLGPIGRQKPADGRIKYIARLGDSLKSVAMKHPALQDVNLWKLVAEVNGISTEVDGKGAPIATLSRGAVLMIPSNVDVEEFRQRVSGSAPPAVSTVSGGVITEVATKHCQGCGRMTVDSATICPACGHAFAGAESIDSAVELDTQTRQLPTQSAEAPVTQKLYDEDAKTVFVPEQQMAAEDAPTQVSAQAHRIEQLHEACRLVRGEGLGIVAQLEVFRGNAWEPVVSYEIYDDVSLRNEHTQDGRKRTVRIDLPPPAARELAGNDLNSNWKQYCSRFLGQQID